MMLTAVPLILLHKSDALTAVYLIAGGVQRLQRAELIVQASKDCVQKTLKRLEEKITGGAPPPEPPLGVPRLPALLLIRWQAPQQAKVLLICQQSANCTAPHPCTGPDSAQV